MRYDEAEFLDWLTRQGEFIRRHGRFPYRWRTLSLAILGMIALVAFAVIHFVFFWEDAGWWPDPFTMAMSVGAIIQIVKGFSRTRLRKVVTGVSRSETADEAEAVLRILGYGPMWTAGKEVGIMGLEASTGFGKQKHILLLAPDDGHLWITAINAESPFTSLTSPKPFRRLLTRLREQLSDGSSAGNTVRSHA
jgi:hypothetical protein